MPSYNLTQNEMRVVVTWLFEPNGYLDFAVRTSDGQTAREALALDAGLDVTQWVRDNPQEDPATSNEVAMVWWIRANDQVNIPTPQRPPEAASWVAILEGWDASIVSGFARAGVVSRNSTSTDMFDENGDPDGTIPSGAHLTHQQQIISKVTGVLS